MATPVIDMHCDLLLYLERHSGRSPFDRASRCSFPQLKQGHVKLQVCAVFTQTDPHSVQKGSLQAQIYQEFPLRYPKDVAHYTPNWNLQSQQIATLMAFENASGFCGEGEPFLEGIKRLHHFIQSISKPLYISLTWNTENRFGGGALTQKGLKEDGKRLLEELHQKRIALDLSHASDALAYEVIEYIDGHQLDIPLMASHSNARAIASVPRNLPDDLAKEIFRRGGPIGLNLCRLFIGENEDFMLKHIAHWLELGGENHIVLGTDFFYDADLPLGFQHGKEIFFPNYQDASCYGRLLEFLQKELNLSDALIEKLAYCNALNFIKHLG